MYVHRFKNSSTSENVEAIVKLMNDSNCKEVILYATHSTAKDGFSESADGPVSNLPLVAAVAKYVIPGITEFYVVFDGSFLTATRLARYDEVKYLMDVAEQSDKTSFFGGKVPFTSTSDPQEAVSTLLDQMPLKPFTTATRSEYFGLLSNLPESQYS